MTRCPCCQQIIPPKGELFSNQPVKRRIYDFLSRHPEGVTREQIMDSVYADDPDGGPDSSKIVAVHVCEMRKSLNPAGIDIVSTWGPDARYTITEYAR